MSLADLAILYLVAGVALSVAVARRESGATLLGSVGLTLVAWPLWAPVVLSASGGAASPRRHAGPSAPAALRIRAALREGVAACAGSSLAKLLPPDAEQRILAEVERVESRREELEELLARDSFDLTAATERVESLEAQEATDRTLAPARTHLANVRRLHDLHARDARALGELADVVEALRTQLVLARYQGSSALGVGDVVTDLWSRVEALGEAMGAESASPRGSVG